MKKINFLSVKILFIITVFISLSNSLFSQCNSSFATASVTENSSGGSISTGMLTGNDSRSTVFGTSPSNIEVNVWHDPSNPGLSWNDGTYTGNLSLPTGAKYPDVALVESDGMWYAIVVYGKVISGNLNCMYDLYYYTGTAFTAYSTLTHLKDASGNNAAFSQIIRIDADASGNFVIIWDTPSLNDIEAIGGYRNAHSPPSFCSSLGISLVTGTQIQDPDVSLFADPQNGTSYIYYVYVDAYAAPNNLWVGYDDFNDFCSNSGGSNNPTFQMLNNGGSGSAIFSNPRIACPPNTNSACNNEWTVVTFFGDNSLYDIIGYTSNCGTLYQNNFYTDGNANTPQGCAIDADPNGNPAVSYDYRHQAIIVGWDSWFTGSTGFNPTQSIAINCDLNGQLNTSTCSPTKFLIVSTGNTNLDARVLSISGRDYNSTQFTFYDYNASDVEYKDVAMPNCNLRLRNPSGIDNFSVYPNPFSENISINFENNISNIKIFDIYGELIFNVFGNEQEINKQLNVLSLKLAPGVYFLKAEDSNGNIIVNRQLIKI